jgi:adenylate kinase family enzyme
VNAERAPQVLILTGVPGAGKTTIARLLSSTHERAVHLETDFFWDFISSGCIEPWTPESNEQNTLVFEIVGDVARRYAQAGYFTIIDGIIGPRWFYEPLRSRLVDAGLRVDYAILRPLLTVAIDRAKERQSTRLAHPEVIEQLLRGFTDLDPNMEANAVIDNSEQTPETTVNVIQERLRLGQLTV